MTQKKQTKKQRRIFSATEKCQAVLAVWLERRTITDICREMQINSTMLSKWQDTAMDGMLAALEPKVLREKSPLLSGKLQKLLNRKNAQRHTVLDKLDRRLELIQQTKPETIGKSNANTTSRKSKAESKAS